MPRTLRGSLGRWRGEIWRALAPTRLYRQSLIGPAPGALRLRLSERWPGDPRRGAAILAGDVEFAAELINRPTPAWFPPGAGEAWMEGWHGFGWLDDLMAIGPSARDPARVLVQSWLSDGAVWHPVSWRSDYWRPASLPGSRISTNSSNATDDPLRRAMLTSLAAQLRHLARRRAGS